MAEAYSCLSSLISYLLQRIFVGEEEEFMEENLGKDLTNIFFFSLPFITRDRLLTFSHYLK